MYRAYSPKGRKSKVDSRVLFKVMVYGYQCGIYSSRKPEESCRYRIDFMWLLEGEKQLQAVQERVEKATGLHKLKDLQEYLKASKENISFVAGQGHRKSEEQRKWEMLDRLCAADAKLCGKRFFGKLFARLKFSGQNRFAQHMIGFIRKRLPFLECL